MIWADTLSQNHQLHLSDLHPGDRAVVVRLRAGGPVRQRLMEMGFVRGQELVIEKLAPLGDPMELVIKGYHLFLRREEGTCIEVRRLAPAEV